MTYQTLLKWKEYFEKKGDKAQLAKVMKNLEKYQPVPDEKVNATPKKIGKSD